MSSDSQKTKLIGTANVVAGSIVIFACAFLIGFQNSVGIGTYLAIIGGVLMAILGGYMRHKACVSQQTEEDAGTKRKNMSNSLSDR